MYPGTLIYLIIVVVAVICLFIMKKIDPDAFWVYFGWVIFNLILGLFLLNPWRIFS